MSPDANYARMLFALPVDAEPTEAMIDIGVRIRSRDNATQNQAVKERLAVLKELGFHPTERSAA